jgi:hypothetical protein
MRQNHTPDPNDLVVANALLLAVMVGIISVSTENQYWWAAPIIAGIGLLIIIWVNFIKSWLRNRKLRHPVKAHFTIRNSQQSLSGRDVSHGDPHLIRRLVLPSNQIVEIELGFLPLIPFYATEIVFGCIGDQVDAPGILERHHQYIESGARPSAEKDYLASNAYHARVDRKYNIGTHYVIGFKIQTKRAGVFPVSLSFITDEIEGNYERLEFLVEDTPSTMMKCHVKSHGRNCLVFPFIPS